MKVTVRAGQSLMDVALQEYGALEPVFDLARLNNISPTEVMSAGNSLERTDIVPDRQMEKYCKDNQISPATDETVDREIVLRIFTREFTQEYM